MSADDDALLADPEGPYYPSVYAFVVDFLAPTMARDVHPENRAWRWCQQWFAHVEAVVRLEACWGAWESLRLDQGTGISVWFRDHADPCFAALTSPDGPFRSCAADRHYLPPVLATATLPAGLVPAGLTHVTEPTY